MQVEKSKLQDLIFPEIIFEQMPDLIDDFSVEMSIGL